MSATFTAEGCEAKLANAAKEKQGQGVEYRFLIIPDNDADPAKGEKTAAKMLDTLTAAGLTAYIARIPASYHDANDYLTKCRAGLEEWAKNAGDHAEEEAHVTYNRQSAAGQIDQWAAEWETGKDTPTETGLYSLDELLDGGLYPGLYVIGALSSLGKTSFCLQIADYVAQSRDVLYIALEQSAAELTAKTLSRLTAELSQASGNEYKNALTARNITSKAKRGRNGKDQMQTLAEAIKQYREGIGKRIFFLDAMTEEKAIGTDEIKKRLEEHKAHRKHYEIAYRGAQIEEERRHSKGPGGRFPLLFIQGRADETPQLIYYIRKGYDNSGKKGDLKMYKKLGRYLDVDKIHREIEPCPPVKREIRR